VTEAAYNSEDRNLNATPFADGRIEVRVDSKLTGQRAIELRNELGGLTSNEQRRRMVDAARNLLPQATIDESSFAISNLTDATAPLAHSLSFTLPQFVERTERRLLLRPALLSHRDESLTPAPTRSNGIYFHYPWSENDRVTIESPDGYELEQLPEPVTIDIGAARYRSAFHSEGRRVIYERQLIVNAINFTANQYPTIKSFFDRVHQADRAVISFKQ